MDRFDVAIIGAGVCGAAIARRLAAYELSVALIDRAADVSFGTSKANSGIIHGGFHHASTHLKSRLEVEGAALYPQLHRELGFPYRQCGLVVAAFTPEELATVEHLYRQGVDNGAPGIEICSASRIKTLEPKLHPDVIGGLFASAGGIIEPYRFVFSLVESAQENGLVLILGFDVASAEPATSGSVTGSPGYLIAAVDGRRIRAEFVVNAAGLAADEVSAAFDAERFEITPRKGQYHLLDRRTRACPERVIFPVPTSVSKGMLVIPTVEGTILLGPTAEAVQEKDDLGTRRDALEGIIASAQRLVPSVSATDVITSFAGLRPTLAGNDFMVEESRSRPGLIHVAGIQSPGLTAAPAIAERVKELIKNAGCTLTERATFARSLPPVARTRTACEEEIRKAWETDPDAAQIVCRCESVTRAEVVEAIRAGHATVDGIKFYSRGTAGRCQGAFCLPKIIEIIAQETGVESTRVSKRGPGSELIAELLPGTVFPTPPPRSKNPHGGRGGDEPAIRQVDALVIGGGAAGMSSAAAIAERGYAALIVDREPRLGGVLRQCIHNGFGIHEFNEELTGPEYAERYERAIAHAEVPALLSTTATKIEQAEGGFVTTVLSRDRGPSRIASRTIVLSMGSRERNRGSIRIPGTRPAGVYTAGAAQRLVNIDGLVPGRRVVIVGSGDIGLIMARRMRLVGAEVPAVIEIQPVPSGINRNIVQCLTDFGIPLYLGHVVTSIHGHDRVSGVTVAPLENGVPRGESAFDIECDTVLLSVGLIPENELSRELGVRLNQQTGGPAVDARLMTEIPGVFAAGNVLHIHDVVDYVAEEASRCGGCVADFLDGQLHSAEVDTVAGSNVRYVMPGAVGRSGKQRVYLRSLIAKNDAVVELAIDGEVWSEHREAHVQPSEMVRLTVDGGALPESSDRLEFSIR